MTNETESVRDALEDSKMTVGRICTRCVDVVEPFERVAVAAKRMHSRKVGTLVVVDVEKRPIGLITDRDLTVRVLAAERDPAVTDVETVMTRGVETVRENCPIETALEVMRSGPFRRVPVVDGEGELLGLVSLDDILTVLAEEFRSIGSLLNAESQQSLAEI
jgi:CBS domain-containing protein